MKDSRYAVTLTPLQTSSACPLVETLHDNVSVRKIKSLVLSVSVRLVESRSQPVPEHAAVRVEERPSPPPPASPSNTQTSWSTENKRFCKMNSLTLERQRICGRLPVSKHTTLLLSLWGLSHNAPHRNPNDHNYSMRWKHRQALTEIYLYITVRDSNQRWRTRRWTNSLCFINTFFIHFN